MIVVNKSFIFFKRNHFFARILSKDRKREYFLSYSLELCVSYLHTKAEPLPALKKIYDQTFCSLLLVHKIVDDTIFFLLLPHLMYIAFKVFFSFWLVKEFFMKFIMHFPTIYAAIFVLSFEVNYKRFFHDF